MAVNWTLGAPGPDIGQQFQAGADHGRAVRQQRDRTSALRGYVANPNDPNAQNALLVADPQLATNLEDQRFQRTHAQHQQALDAMTEHRDRIIMGAQFLQGVTDEAGYQRALGLARQAGMELSDVPQHFDPQYVRGITQLAQHLQAVQHPQQSQQPTNIEREVAYYRSIGRDDLAQQLIARHAYGQPNPDGTYSVPPGVGAPGAQPPPHVLTDDDIRRMEQGGGAGQPQAHGTFPR